MYNKPRSKEPYGSCWEMLCAHWPKRATAIRSKKKRIRKKYSWFMEMREMMSNEIEYKASEVE